MADILLEICVDDADGLQTAIDAGADRIELCSALALGGLTPTPGLMRLAARAPVPVMAMIRPKAGPLVASEADVRTMVDDIDAVRDCGLAGVVIGLLTPEGDLDLAAIRRLANHAKGLSLTLHRAVDCLSPAARRRAVETAIDLGFDRILTSGGARTAIEGADDIGDLIGLAGGRIAIMPGSGISAGSIGRLLDHVAVGEVHASCSAERGPDQPDRFGFGSGRKTDGQMIRALKAALAGRGGPARD